MKTHRYILHAYEKDKLVRACWRYELIRYEIQLSKGVVDWHDSKLLIHWDNKMVSF